MAQHDNGHWLNKRSDEYDAVNYQVSLSFGKCKDVEVWKVVNNEFSCRFKTKHEEELKLISWVNTAEIFSGSEANLLQLIHKGFNFPADCEGMYFATGCVDVPELILPETTFSFIYCDIAVGKSYALAEPENSPRIPEGFDSCCFDRTENERYMMKYFISDSQKLLPKYVVKLTKCKNGVYTSNRASKPDANAGLRQQRVSSLQRVLGEACAVDQQLEKRNVRINDLLDSADEKMRGVTMSYADACDEIDAQAAKAKEELKRYTKSKMNTLKSLESELKRQQNYAAWLTTHMRSSCHPFMLSMSQNTGVTPSYEDELTFLQHWKIHTVLRNSMLRGKIRQEEDLYDVNPKITVNNNFTIDEVKTNMFSAADGEANKDVSGKDSDLDTFLSQAFVNGYYMDHADASEELIFAGTQVLIDDCMLDISEQLSSVKNDKPAVMLPLSIAMPTTVINNCFSAKATVNGNGFDPRKLFQEEFRKVVAPGGDGCMHEDDRSVYSSGTGQSVHAVAPPPPSTPPPPPPPPVSLKGAAATLSAVNKFKGKLSRQSTTPKGSSTSTLPPTPPRSIARPGGSISSFSPKGQGPASSMGNSPFVSSSIFCSDMQQMLSQRFASHALTTLADRKIKQLQCGSTFRDTSFNELMFRNSSILNVEDAETLYFSLPFFSGSPPLCKLVYSTFMHPRGFEELYERCAEVQTPMVLLVKSDSFTFGSFLSHPLYVEENPNSDDGHWSGSPSCFLFSITLDTKLSYHGKNPVRTDNHFAFMTNNQTLVIGNGDLILKDNLKNGSSEIEHCFGIGLGIQSPEAQRFLAGNTDFKLDQVEVWSLQ